MTLEDVLAPVTVESFLTEFVGERYLLVRGASDRFRGLVTWADLNDTLSRLRTTNGRVSLVRRAQSIARSSYVHTGASGEAEYLNGAAVAKHVAEGATLVVNQVDELLPEVRRLAESCEAVFDVYTFANLYAGWRTDHGFDVHWDRHDTLIVQVIGRKDWKVWCPTCLHPLSGEGTLVPAPSTEPIWQGTLEAGNALYMPRGWWHVAQPRNEPSVHVTLGMKYLTGIDLLTWAVEQVKVAACARMDLPRWKNHESQVTWLRELREALAATLTDDSMQTYMSSLHERAHGRPVIKLPESSYASAVGALTPLRLVGGRELALTKHQNGELSFTTHGKAWRCHEGLAPALALLKHSEPCSLDEMQRVVRDVAAKHLLQPLIMAMIMADVIWAEHQSGDR